MDGYVYKNGGFCFLLFHFVSGVLMRIKLNNQLETNSFITETMVDKCCQKCVNNVAGFELSLFIFL